MVIIEGTGGESQEWRRRKPGRAGPSATPRGGQAAGDGQESAVAGGWKSRRPERHRASPGIQPDARELLPGGSNETTGATRPGFF